VINTHPYIPNASSVTKEMLRVVGVRGLDDLFVDIPSFPFEIDELLPEPIGESGVKRIVEETLSKNKVYGTKCFAGGGPWFHFIPSAVRHIISRGEFPTSYTPYQAEVSQGILQAFFEFQSLICELYDMEVANASMYDLSTAVAESALLCARVTGRKKIIIPACLPWERKSVIANYTEPQGVLIEEAPYSKENGGVDLERLKEVIDDDVAGVYVENPSFLGMIDNGVKGIVEISHDSGALAVVGCDPLSLGVLKPPGELGADVAVGNGQPLGIAPAMGGNTLGIMACREDPGIVRQMPGRIVGMTKTADGRRRGYVLALSTREQHIRREKATSNICTNQALLAVAATIYLSMMGRTGLASISRKIIANTEYAKDRMRMDELIEPIFQGINFRDFAMTIKGADDVDGKIREKGMVGGRNLSEDFPEMKDGRLFAVTEVHTKKEIDELTSSIHEALGGA